MHSWAVAILTYWWLLGVALIVAPIWPEWSPVTALARDQVLGVVMGATLAAGAGLALGAGAVRWKRRTTRYLLEQLGLIAMTGGWLAWVWVTGWSFPDSLAGWAQGAASAAACLLRLLEVRTSERATRKNVAATMPDGGGR